MNSKILTAALVLGAVAANNSFASIARQAVLLNQPAATTTSATGISTSAVNGSLWYDDDYNVFYSPVQILNYKNMITVNKGIEGGFFKGEMDNFAYGIYMNRGGVGGAAALNNANMVAPGIASNVNYLGTQAAATTSTKRPIDVFFAGDTGIKWGLGITWAYNRNETIAGSAGAGNESSLDARYWNFKFSAELMGFEPFIGTTMFSQIESTATNAQAMQKLDELNAGVRYKYEGWTPYVAYKQFRQSGTPLAGATVGTNGVQHQTQVKMMGLGVGHTTKVADGVNIMKNVGFWMHSVEDDLSTASGQANAFQTQDYKDMIVPVNVAIEADATSWLVLRAGATYDFINERKFAKNAATNSQVNDKRASQDGIAKFRIGSTLKFGKLAIDSAFGVDTSLAATTATAADQTLDNNSVGFDRQTFALLSANYRW